MFAAAELAAGRLVKVFENEVASEYAIYAVCLPRRLNDPMVSGVMEWLSKGSAELEATRRRRRRSEGRAYFFLPNNASSSARALSAADGSAGASSFLVPPNNESNSACAFDAASVLLVEYASSPGLEVIAEVRPLLIFHFLGNRLATMFRDR